MDVKLVWITPDAEAMIVHMARVSNPESQKEGANPDRLLRYLIRHKHWSPFEMAGACVEIDTTRDIARQILRHRSFSFQEFSTRYAEQNGGMQAREARMQDHKNRQNSLESDDPELAEWWAEQQQDVWDRAQEAYRGALGRGIAKEQARSVLPEGLTPSRMYMAGSIRSWLHYLHIRRNAATQKEHRQVAEAIARELLPHIPTIMVAGAEL